MNPKQSIAFPEVAILRKGSPKRKNKNGGYPEFIQGTDLGNVFRLAFLPGTDHHKQAFESIYCTKEFGAVKKVYGSDYAEPEGYEVARLRCCVVTRSALDAWEWGNEAYNAGRLVARADDEKFLMMRDPTNGTFLVQDGEPYTPYTVGQTIDYKNAKGATVKLPIKTHGRLRLLLYNFGRMVYVTLKTTSFYDRLNITANLAAIQFLAETLNNGNAAGIPFYIYRRQQEVVWNKPDGSAQRVKKWVVNIEADPEWVASAMARLSRFALGDGGAPLSLPAPVEISTPIDPAQDGEDEAEPGQAEDIIEGEAEAEPQPEPEGEPFQTRPYKPEVVKEKLASLSARYAQYKTTDTERLALDSVLGTTFNGNADHERALCEYLFGHEPEPHEQMAMIKWLRIVQGKDGFYPDDALSVKEARAIVGLS